MVQCPACGVDIEQNFGMVTCSECQAVFMISFDGTVEFGIESPPEEEADTVVPMEAAEVDSFSNPEETFGDEASEPIEDVVNDGFDTASDGFDDFGIGEPVAETDDTLAGDTEDWQDDLGEDSVDEVVASSENDPVEDFPTEGSGEDAEDSSFPEDGFAMGVPMGAGAVTSNEEDPGALDNTPVDITDFANSEASSLDKGDFVYTLVLERVDSKELRQSVRSVLADKKLGLVAEKLMRSLDNGRLEIPDLHPLNAKIIVEQLQYYDLDMRWSQRAVIIEGNEENL